MSEHTPTDGPWIFNSDFMEVQEDHPTEYRILAKVATKHHLGDVPEEEAVANGKLMAAAPQLLAAAKEAEGLLATVRGQARMDYKLLESIDAMIIQLRLAIQSSTGE